MHYQISQNILTRVMGCGYGNVQSSTSTNSVWVWLLAIWIIDKAQSLKQPRTETYRTSCFCWNPEYYSELYYAWRVCYFPRDF